MRFGPRQRAKLARAAVLLCLLLWPVSMFTWARGEAPTVLFLSWAALVISLADVAATTDVREHDDDPT